MEELTLADALKNSPFPTGITAAQVVSDMDNIFDARAPRLGKIKDQYDRRPPWDPALLRENGQSYRANINTGEMEALLDNETSEATLSVFHATPTASFKAHGVSLSLRKKLASAYDEFLKQSKSFSWFHFVDRIHFETNSYGYSAATFADTKDWRPRWQPHFEMRFPEDATPDVTDLDAFAVHTKTTLQDLFEVLTFNPDEVATGWVKGWNVEELRKFLVMHIQGNTINNQQHYTNLYLESAQALRDGTGWAATTTRFRKVNLTHVYAVHPKTGKVAHYILTEEPPMKEDEEHRNTDQNMPNASPDSGIVYYSEKEFSHMSESLWIMCYNLGPSTLASVRGLGYRAYTHTDLSNRTFSQIIDSSTLASSLLLETGESDTSQRVPLVRLGPVAVISNGFKPIQNSFQPNYQHLINVRDMSSSVMHSNLGTYRQQPNSFQPSQKSAREVEAEVQAESEAKQNRSTYRMQMWSGLHKEVFRRVSNSSWLGGLSPEEFTEMAVKNNLDLDKIVKDMDSTISPQWRDILNLYLVLIRLGFPLNVLFDLRWSVESNKGFGAGSSGARISALNDILPLGATLPKEKTDALKHAYVLERTANPDLADEMFPAGMEMSDSKEFLMVVLENNDMKEGRQIPVPEDVDHITHFESHLTLFYTDVQEWQQEANEENTTELAALARTMIPHLGGHLEHISRDPVTASRTSTMEQEFKKVISVAQTILQTAQGVVKKNQEERDALSQKLAELEAKANDNAVKMQLRSQEINNEFELEQIRAEGLNQSRMYKTQAQIESQAQKGFADEQRKMQSHMVEMQQKMDRLLADREKLSLENTRLRQQLQTSPPTPTGPPDA